MFHEQEHLKRRLQHESHSTNHKQLFQCLECGKQYNTQLGYRRHLVAAHGTTTTTAATTTTTTGLPCPEGPPSLLEQLGGHIDRPLEGSGGGGGASVAVRERKYSCERCDRRFYTRKDVRRHAVVHTGRRDFLCPRCAQRFGRRDHLTRHLKKSHAQEGAVLPHHCTPATASPGGGSAARQCLVKEEASPVASELGSVVSKEALEPQYPRDVYPSYPMANAVPGLAHSAHGGLMQNHHHHHHHLSSGMSAARHMQPPQSSHHHMQTPPQPQPPYGGGGSRYQHGSTSFPRAEVDSFLLDLQSAPSPHLSVASASTPASPQREVLGEGVVGVAGADPHLLCRSPAVPSSDLSCTANMDLGPLLGFLPFGLPPYSPHMGMSGLVMSYPPPPPATTSSTAASSPSSSSSSQAPPPPPPPPAGPFSLFQPPQAHHVSQGQAAVHSHSQLPQAYSSPSMSTSSSLPHYYQAFQQ
ncbi:zinc finger protein PLAGL2-like [Nelusetta ayraudi]|uniref:zinc finger protein PLAGL2-like n=1 Tax=Nelusetta ayraudi TaxID=303726 RepID=UPI003F72FF72